MRQVESVDVFGHIDNLVCLMSSGLDRQQQGSHDLQWFLRYPMNSMTGGDEERCRAAELFQDLRAAGASLGACISEGFKLAFGGRQMCVFQLSAEGTMGMLHE